jgi:predicted GIY-YIG superfamily endonuclease
MKMKIICYLLHFERPISDRHTCQHYLGSCVNLTRRLKQHKSGKGKKCAKLCKVAKERNIGFVVVRIWTCESRKFEYTLKRRKNGKRMCPVCNPRKASVIKSDVDFYGMLDDLQSGTVKPFVTMPEATLEAIEEEHVGEEFSRQPYLF